MKSVSLRQAKLSFFRLVDDIESGREHEIIITRNGRPVAKLMPIDSRPPAQRIGVVKKVKMSIETKSLHVTQAGDNVFTDLGFDPETAATLKAESQRIISEKLAIKDALMTELAEWIEAKNLTQAEAVGILCAFVRSML